MVVLSGDLGAGKTCFVQGAARARGVSARVTSPSFVIMRSYDGDVRIVHADVYRLDSIQELYELGFEDLFDPEAITFIEWGDAVAGELPARRLNVTITADGDARRIAVEDLR